MTLHPTFTKELAAERTNDRLREADGYRLATTAAAVTLGETTARDFDSMVLEHRFVRRRRWFVRHRALGRHHSLPL